MQFPKLTLTARTKWRAAAAVLAALTLVPQDAKAESAFVAQIPANVVADVPLASLAAHEAPQPSYNPLSAELPYSSTIATTQGGLNITNTVQIGNYNTTYHLQNGANNVSSVGIVGSYNNVAVLQSGNNLRSNVVLLNTVGVNVGVFQTNGSAPVNVLVARMPGRGS